MKKLATLLLAAGLVFCGVTGASAIDFKAKGQWIMSFDYGQGMSGYTDTRNGGDVYGSGYGGRRGADNFNANQRVRLQIDAVASESLSGTVYFEIGESQWGHVGSGGALGADRTIVEIKQAYLDWIIPNTEVKVRMGIQGIGLPALTGTGSQVFINDVAGIVVSNKFSDNVSLTAFWARPYNDNFEGNDVDNHAVSAGFLDNVDAFGLVMPLTFDGFKIIPWVTYTMVGQNFARSGNPGQGVSYGLLPLDPISGAAITSNNHHVYDELFSYGNVWHAGLTGEITAADPFRIAWDVNYGHAYFGSADGNHLDSAFGVPAGSFKDYEAKREGWFASLLFEYKMDWGTPGLYGWYSSGDDGDPYNGSERMPSISNGNSDNYFSAFAGNGNPYIAREGILGTTLIGTWGVGVRLKDFSFMEDLKHTFRINYFQGTNSTDMAAVVGSGFNANGWEQADAGFYQGGGTGNGLYLTTEDHAFEFGLSTDYKIYENLTLYVEAAYLALSFDQGNDVWGDRFSATDAWNVNASFVYSF